MPILVKKTGGCRVLKSKSLPVLAALLPAAIGGALCLAMLAAPASAGVVDDPLHGYCSPAATQCIDNGTNSPTTNIPPKNFGFTVSPGPATGDLMLDILVPDNKGPISSPSSFTITGTLPGTANLFSSAPWTSGMLDAYLGISASPANPIGAYLPSTQALDPGATGFLVYDVNLGSTTLQGPSNPNVSPLENISAGTLPLASYIVGFLNEGTSSAPDWVATANSGAIFATPAPVIGHGLPVLLAVGGILFGAKLLEPSKKRGSLGTAAPHAA